MTELTNASFEDFIRANRFAVVHFWATWNGYDATMKDLLGSQSLVDVGQQIAFGRFDTDSPEHHDLCTQLKVFHLPFLASYRDGSLVNGYDGYAHAGRSRRVPCESRFPREASGAARCAARGPFCNTLIQVLMLRYSVVLAPDSPRVLLRCVLRAR